MRGWGSIPAGGSPPWPREKPGASGWALRVPSAAAGVGSIVCSPGEGSRGWRGTASGGAGPRGAAASPPRRALPAPSSLGVRLPALKKPGPCRAAAPRVLLGAECLCSCSWSWGKRGGGLMATGGLVLAGLLPAVLVKEPG